MADEIFRLRELKQQAAVDGVTRDEQISRITEYNERLVKRLMQKITVFENHFTVAFKSGVSIDIEG